jgi:hypothetical protein
MLADVTGVHRVAIVVAPSFELERLAGDRHVWALRAPEYERVAQERWSAVRGDGLDHGITLFDSSGLSPEAELVEILPVVDEHHGEPSHIPAVSEIEVFGAHPTPEVRAELSAYGFDDISASPRGFTARRDA